MKHLKRLITAILALCMVLSLVACNKPADPTDPPKAPDKQPTGPVDQPTTPAKEYYNKTGYPICDEPIKISVGGVITYTNDWNSTVMVKTVREKLGIEMDCNPVAKDAFASQYALMLANDEQPDLLINLTGYLSKAQSNIDGEAGYWLDLSQYLDIMPNFAKALEDNPEWAAYTRTETGAIYGVNWFTCSTIGLIGGMLYMNRAVAESVGYTDIKTLDDFYNCLTAVKAQRPDLIPLGLIPTAKVGYSYMGEVAIKNAFGINHRGAYAMMARDENGQVYYIDTTDNYRNYLTFMNKLYEEELLDNECFIRTQEEHRAKIWDFDYAAHADSGLSCTQMGIAPLDYIWIPSLVSDEYPEHAYTITSPVIDGVKILVKADTEYPEAICRMIDYMFTEEGIYLSSQYGVEGETFDWVENKYGIKTASYDNYADLTKFESGHAWSLQNNCIHQGMQFYQALDRQPFNGLSNEVLIQMANDEELDISTRSNAATGASIADIETIYHNPAPLVYTEEEAKERNTLRTDIVNYLETMKVAFINGEKDITSDTEWEAYLQQLEAMGYDRLMEIETAAWGRMG